MIGRREKEGEATLTRFIKSNVSIFPNSSEEKFDTASSFDSFLIIFTFLDEVWIVPVEDMDVLRVYIHY